MSCMHKSLWQARNYSLQQNDNETGFNKSHIIRSNITQAATSTWKAEFGNKYQQMVIQMETSEYGQQQNSTDRCYAAALQLVNNPNMQSKAWISSLSVDNCRDLFEDGKEDMENVQMQNKSPTKLLPSSTTDMTKSFSDINTKQNTNKIFNSRPCDSSTQQPKKPKMDVTQNENDFGVEFAFRSAREQYEIDQLKNNTKTISPQSKSVKKSLGSRPRNQCFSKFVPPCGKGKEESDCVSDGGMLPSKGKDVDTKVKGIEPQLIEIILSEIMDHGPSIEWDDIAGLEDAKSTIKEIVVWPLLRPDIFTGLRGPPKGILLFGPPGTGKTLIGKCIASQSGATFFSISASSLTSKWIGQGEKLVRALFVVANMHQPSVIFIDEIDSLLSQRSDTEHESSRRIKTEFFVQLDGATTSSEDRILVVGATNRPQEIDEAARRRLVKRLYIPLPDENSRGKIIQKLLKQQLHDLNETDIRNIVSATEGYSGADVTNLCKEAALGPIRSLKVTDISHIHKDDVRPIQHQDFKMALRRVKTSVSGSDIEAYETWNETFGCGTL